MTTREHMASTLTSCGYLFLLFFTFWRKDKKPRSKTRLCALLFYYFFNVRKLLNHNYFKDNTPVPWLSLHCFILSFLEFRCFALPRVFFCMCLFVALIGYVVVVPFLSYCSFGSKLYPLSLDVRLGWMKTPELSLEESLVLNLKKGRQGTIVLMSLLEDLCLIKPVLNLINNNSPSGYHCIVSWQYYPKSYNWIWRKESSSVQMQKAEHPCYLIFQGF